MAKILGNDVASYQGDINFDVYKNNSNFLIIKATEGVGFKDPKFARNQSESRRVGLPLGYYHFARPDLNPDATKEAQWFLATLGEIKEGEVLVLDYEPNWSGDAAGWCKVWLDYVYQKTGTRPLIYLNQSQVRTINWISVVNAGYGLWIAAYTYDPNNNNYAVGQWQFAAMQQWTSSQKVPGIPANAVDGNVFFGDINMFKKYGYKNPSVPTPPTSSVITDGNAVIRLDGEDLKLNDASSKIAGLKKRVADLEKVDSKYNQVKSKVDDIKKIYES